MSTPENIAKKIILKYGAEAFKASKRPEILTTEIKLDGQDPNDFHLRNKVTLALLPKRVSHAS